MGYAQLTDSRFEGHLTDMVFRPLGNAPWPEVRVESKATELSLSNPDLLSEVRSYLKEWLSNTVESRFKFMLFAKKLVNLSRWDLIWGNSLSESEAMDWLIAGLDKTSAEYFTDQTRVKEVARFFSQTNVVEGTDADLIDMAEAKKKVGLSANEIRQRALRQLGLMDQRSRPIPKKSNLVGNLLHFIPPSVYIVLGIDTLSTAEIRGLMKGRESPPYRILEAGELLTLDYVGVEGSFKVLHPIRHRSIDLEELNSTYPRCLAELTNFSIGKFLRRLGVGFDGARSYFLAEKEVARHQSRVLELSSGETMQVAKPYHLKPKKSEFEDVGYGELNFVFHLAFNLRYRNLWGQHFIEFKLGKLYTKDGKTVIEGGKAARLDAHFRNPAFDRSETRQHKLEKLSTYVFQDRHNYPDWARLFAYGEFLKLPTNWTPDAVPLEQAMIDDFGKQDNGEDTGDVDTTS
jgi:hypothetical protein